MNLVSISEIIKNLESDITDKTGKISDRILDDEENNEILENMLIGLLKEIS